MNPKTVMVHLIGIIGEATRIRWPKVFLGAVEAVRFESIGIEKYKLYLYVAKAAVPTLMSYTPNAGQSRR